MKPDTSRSIAQHDMVRTFFCLALLVISLLAGCASTPTSSAPPTAIKWEEWSDDIFARAKRENKFVLLDLHAVWCHWCHVMDETTYKDPRVQRLIAQKYIAVGVDQDLRPDLSNRYEDYGWPATIVFNADGGEIAKRRGYLPPEEMASLLEAIIADPTPGPSVKPAKAITPGDIVALTAEQCRMLESRISAAYDDKEGAWGTDQKFLNWDNVEYCLVKSAAGDERARTMARQTLDAQRKLLDPVWGGVYQYSTDGDWDHPHFEKIMQMQAENLRIYSQAYALWKQPQDLETAQKIRSYLKTFLTSPDGAFYTSQDADLVPGEHSGEYFTLDDAHRRAKGIPKVDTHIYSRENGWAITGLVWLYCASGDEDALNEAERAAKWIIDHHTLPGGGFAHAQTNAPLPFLGDTLAMGRAFLALYIATGDRAWLQRAVDVASFIDAHFESFPGFTTLGKNATSSFQDLRQWDENLAAARFTNLLFRYTGTNQHRKMAESAMRYLVSPEAIQSRGFGIGGLLLADREIASDPLHISVVGPKDNAQSHTLFDAAIGHFNQYKRVDYVDPHDPPLPNTDVTYPELSRPAAFICTGASCSSPISDPAKLIERLNRAGKP